LGEMESFLSRGKKAFSSWLGTELPPDETLETCEKHLTMLLKSIDHMQLKFEKYSALMNDCADAGRLMGNDVMKFYGRAQSRHAQAKCFASAQENIQSCALDLWKQSFHDFEGVSFGFSQWKNEVNELRSKLEDTEKLRQACHNNQEKLNSLNDAKRGSVFGRMPEVERKQQTYLVEKEYKEQLELFKETKELVSTQTRKFLTNRFAKFDAIFVNFMELQSAFFQKSNGFCDAYKNHVKNYREKNPKQAYHREELPHEEHVPHEEEESSSSSTDEAVEAQKHPVKKTTEKKKPPTSNQKKNGTVKKPSPISASKDQPSISRKARATPRFEEADLLGQIDGSTAPPESTNQNSNTSSQSNQDDFFATFNEPAATKNEQQDFSFPRPNEQKQPAQSSELDDFMFPKTTNSNKKAPSSHNSSDAFDFFSSPPSNKSQTKQADSNADAFDSMFGSNFSTTNTSTKKSSPKPAKTSAKNSSSNPGNVFDPFSSNFDSKKKDVHYNASFNKMQQAQPPPESGRVFKDTDLPDDPKLRAEVERRMNKKVDELRILQQKEKMESDIRANAQEQVKNIADRWEFSGPGVQRNLRTLLATMPDMLNYSGCSWKPVPLHKLLTPKDVKKSYRKAMKVVHPDRTGTLSAENRAKSERVFRALTESFEEFEKQGKI